MACNNQEQLAALLGGYGGWRLSSSMHVAVRTCRADMDHRQLAV
jgi:hypothetical protein